MKPRILLLIVFLSLTTVSSMNLQPQSVTFDCPLDNSVEQTIFSGDPWWINRSPGPACQSPMSVYVDGVYKGTTFLLKFGHLHGSGFPEIAAIYNTGYLRLTPPGLPYGTSFVLGPAYWTSGGSYVHNVQISRIDIQTTGDALQLTIQARDYDPARWPNYRLAVTYQITFPGPTANATQMAVTQSFQVAAPFSISAQRQAEHQGFKWVQFSSMYLNSVYHDSDSLLYTASDETIVYVPLSGMACDTLLFGEPGVLSASNPWVEMFHGDDLGWQGNTPNTVVFLNSPGSAGQSSVQAVVNCPDDPNVPDPNDDNIGAWINHEAAPLSFQSGDTGSLQYTLIAQDDPREPSMRFSDVPFGYWAWHSIERLYNAGITGGCGVNPLKYCPEGTVTRAQMAVFLVRGFHGSSYTPPAVGNSTGFTDVPATHWAAAWIKELAFQGITSGCGSGRYCPEAPVTRAEMAVFLLRSRYGANYGPPAVGSSTGFGDVPTTHWAAAWIKQLVAEGITAGCGNGNYCPHSLVTRAQMAVFLVRTFALP